MVLGVEGMLIKNGAVQLRATCNRVLEALSSENLGKVLNNLLEPGKETWRLILRGEAKDRAIAIKLSVQRESDKVRIEGISELGLQGVLMEFRCSEKDGYAYLAYTVALNPVALGVNRGVVETTLNSMIYGLAGRLASVLRETMRPEPEIREKYLSEEFIARALAKGEIVDRRAIDAKELDIVSIAVKHADRQILISATAEGVDLKVVVIGASYAAKLKSGELEYYDEQAVAKVREVPSKLTLTVYSIDSDSDE